MRNQTLFLLFFGALTIAVLCGCAPKPDLAAVKLPDLGTDPIAYCNLDDQGGLIVTVTNQGTADAPESFTSVTFTTSTGDVVVDLRTPPLPMGESENLNVGAMPANCFQADCFFTITVDATSVMDEANEADNSARGYCLG